MSNSTNVLVLLGIGIAAFIGYSYFTGKSTSSVANNIGNATGTTIGSAVTGIGSGFFSNVVNPTSPIALQQNNAIRSSFNLPLDTSQVQYYPFTPIPIQAQAQNNDIRSFFGLLPENNNVQYYPFTNIPIGRTA